MLECLKFYRISSLSSFPAYRKTDWKKETETETSKNRREGNPVQKCNVDVLSCPLLQCQVHRGTGQLRLDAV